VLNLPSDTMVPHLNALAKTTGREDMSAFKKAVGYRYVKDKSEAARLKPMPSEQVEPPRIKECPVRMEEELVEISEMSKNEEGMPGFFSWAGC